MTSNFLRALKSIDPANNTKCQNLSPNEILTSLNLTQDELNLFLKTCPSPV